MNLHNSLAAYLNSLKNTSFATELGERGGYITFSNSGKRGEVKSFTISLAALLLAFNDIEKNLSEFAAHQHYIEGIWRDFSEYFTDLTIRSNITVQTKPVFVTLSKLVGWANNKTADVYQDGEIEITLESVTNTIEELSALIDSYPFPKDEIVKFKLDASGVNCLPKPFLLLAGISGTGKTRFVREQAEASHQKGNPDNYCLIPVRPDWHEPSDLLGYISRIGGVHYVVTDLLHFVVSAWKDAFASADSDQILCNPASGMTPYWLCLDEMNLAPVEQYFADYLSVVETRKWKDDKYTCDPLLKAATIKLLDSAGQQALRKKLELEDEKYEGLWDYFIKVGIPLPPNLIVAGTVNMDETTHGFSRKVIDRAFTIDFGVFYPNDFDEFFDEDKITTPKTLSFPLLSRATKAELSGVIADESGAKSVVFLDSINAVLKGSPFELAYRALNELLLAVVCFNPKDEAELQAVWDDFLMSKVLPRIDGDGEKLNSDGTLSLLTRLQDEIAIQFKGAGADRPDLLREKSGGECRVSWRASAKLSWMQKRLDANGFTTFWP